jgi:hypothetical protein
MMWTRIAFLLAALPLLGCGSSPKTNFFTLEPVKSQTQATQNDGAAIQLAAVHIPPALDRREMVRRTGGEALDVSDQDRWGAPFDEMVQRTLTQDLASRLPPGRVIYPDQPAPTGTDPVVIDILEFADDGAGRVVFQGSWSVLKSGSSVPLLDQQIRLSAPVGGKDFAGEAEAMSTVLGQLSDRIAARVAGLKAEKTGAQNAPG